MGSALRIQYGVCLRACVAYGPLRLRVWCWYAVQRTYSRQAVLIEPVVDRTGGRLRRMASIIGRSTGIECDTCLGLSLDRFDDVPLARPVDREEPPSMAHAS